MKHIIKSAAISIIIGALSCNAVLADATSMSFLRPCAFGEKSEDAEIAEYVARQPILKMFQHNARVFRDGVSRTTAEMKTMIDEQESPLNNLLNRIIVPTRFKRSGEPTLGERHSRPALEVVKINLDAVSGIVAGTLGSGEYADALNAALVNTGNILMIAQDRVEDEEEGRQIVQLLDKLTELQIFCQLFVSCAAVLRNGRHFQSGNFDSDVIEFVKNPQYPLLDRGNVACEVCLVLHTVGGLAALCALEREMTQEQRAANEEAIKITINNVKELDAAALKMASLDLFTRLIEARSSDEVRGVCRLLRYFRDEKALDIELVDKAAVSKKVLGVGDSVKDLDTARELAILLVHFDKEKAIQVVQSGRPGPLLYFVFISLEAVLESGAKIDPAQAERINAALRERFDASRWPAVLTSSDLEQHMARPPHRHLCAELAQKLDAGLRDETLFKAFQLNCPGEREGVQLERFTEAFVRAYRSAQATPRHLFLPTFAEFWAGDDIPLHIPFGFGQTISQPFLEQNRTVLVDPRAGDKALEIGTGSGYQTARLARLVKEVCSIEVYRPLSERAKQVCDSLGLTNIIFHKGDGSEGWPAEAPFDIIMVSAKAPNIPDVLLRQLNPQGGRLLIPIQREGEQFSTLVLVVRRGDEYKMAPAGPTQWVPLVGAAGYGFETPRSRQPFIDFSPPPMKKEIHLPDISQLSAI